MNVNMHSDEALPVDTRSLVTRWYAGYVLTLLALAYAVNVMDRSVLAVLLESIKHTFHTTDTRRTARTDRKSTRLNSSHSSPSRMPSSA